MSRLAESQLKIVMVYNQSYATDGTLTVNSLAGPMTKSSSGFGVERNVQTQKALNFGGMPRALNPDGIANFEMTQAAAITAANRWIQLYVTPTSRQMAEEIARIGAGGGIYTYNEEVWITRKDQEPIRKVLSFIMTVDRTGRAVYGAPVLSTPDPDIVHITYTPLKAADEFESENWTFPEGGGTLTYSLLDARGNLRVQPVTVDVRGAYDAPSGNSVDMVGCLMDKARVGCNIPADVVDAKTLMHEFGSDLVIVDYTNQLSPVYDEVPAADGGEPDYVPRGAVSYNDRLWNCKEYKNSGVYGYVLEVTADRYYGKLEGDNTVTYNFTDQYAGTMLSDMKPFNKAVLASAIVGDPAQYLISHLTDDNTLLKMDSPDVRNVQYVAPVRSVGDPESFAKAKVSGMTFRKTEENGPYAFFYWGTNGDHNRSSGQFFSSLTFDLETEEDFAEFGITRQVIDDWSVIKVNGTPVASRAIEGLSSVAWGGTKQESSCVANACGGIRFWQSGGHRGNSWTLNTADAIARHLEIREVTNWVCDAPYSSDDGQYRACMANPQRQYKSCRFVDAEEPYYRCGNTTCGGGLSTSNIVEYIKNGVTTCYRGDNGETSSNTYIDLVPYLKAGTNVITMDHVVTRTGHAHVNFRIAGCAAKAGLPLGGPAPVPGTGTPAGIESALKDNMGRPAITD